MRLAYVLDTNDLETAADFWCAALSFEREPGQHPVYVALKDPGGRWPDLLLQLVPEPRPGKNRMHMDLVVADHAAETARLVGLGARVLTPARAEDGHVVVVLADPEGNEFCVVESPTETGSGSGDTGA
ncbi:VOC family protein [Nocardiopsis ganjiahuensis]|uniref:VOC family protein n=1 Tax=Nocardiopsis ganjiahuensis TaxID=239984 RepID=UPI00034A326E|nr:VOC family protein [Nocardiopsis ganjiahuensis]